ncbi:MAG: TetR/AcrR family transcriptional regulator [Deltaproteobacteria bacterium]|nr:TetR/AcrR family transcriptional regulator [Deltaproteobacteria bacterium]
MAERKRLRPDLRKQQILDAAVHLFHQVGFEAASLRDLASMVGINKATIYHYFESKEEILFHIVQKVGDELLNGVRDASKQPGRPLGVLEAMIRFQLGYVESHTEEIKVLVEEKKSLGADLHKEIRSTEAEIFRLYEEILRRCQSERSVRPLHLATSAFAILGQINWLYHWYQPKGSLSIPQLTEEIVTILFRGLVLDGHGPA